MAEQIGKLSVAEVEEESLFGGPEEPHFPLMITAMALFKDGGDMVSLGLLGWFMSIMFGILLWLWIVTKSGFIQRRLTRWFLTRFVLALLVGMVPGLNFLPEATILVLLVHNREKAIVKGFYAALETVRGGGAIRAVGRI